MGWLSKLLYSMCKYINGCRKIKKTLEYKLTNKGTDYFRWLLESQNKSKTFIFKEILVSQKTQEANYSVIELIA